MNSCCPYAVFAAVPLAVRCSALPVQSTRELAEQAEATREIASATREVSERVFREHLINDLLVTIKVIATRYTD